MYLNDSPIQKTTTILTFPVFSYGPLIRNAIEEVRKLKQVNLQLIEENRQLRKAAKDPMAAARRQIQKEEKHASNNELRRRGMAHKRALDAGMIEDTATSPLKRAMGGVWLEATRNSKAVGGRGSQDRQLAVLPSAPLAGLAIEKTGLCGVEKAKIFD